MPLLGEVATFKTAVIKDAYAVAALVALLLAIFPSRAVFVVETPRVIACAASTEGSFG